MKNYEILPTLSLNAHSSYRHQPPLPQVSHLDDPALSLLIDFATNYPFTVKPDASITHALMEMEVCGVHLLLVIDEEDEVVGFITSEHILGEKTIRFINEKRLPRSEVLVRMVMRPQAEVAVLEYVQLEHAKVGHIINTMRAARQHYMLVVETDQQNRQIVRGIFSLSLLGKQLGTDYVSDVPEARTIAELSQKLEK